MFSAGGCLLRMAAPAWVAWTSALVALFAVALPSRALAQVTLTGTYIRYVAVGEDGTFIARSPTGESCPSGICSEGGECVSGSCVQGQSMQYGETAGPPVTCDAFYPGSPQESFTIEATAATGRMLFTNSGVTGVTDEISRVSGPALSGRAITWRGRASRGPVVIDVEQTVIFEPDDRAVRVVVQLTNAGTATLTDVFYLRNADPDHGQCNIGTDFATWNDVRRQPPSAESALATAEAGDGAGPGRRIVLGIGAHDGRARVHNGGFANTDASGEWMSPRDGEGMLNDEAVDIVFREAMLAPGTSTTFEFFYVWGTTPAEVEMRFDDLGFPTAPCAGLAEGASCTASGRPGLCRGGRCCTGCWDGSRCRAGTSSTQCGGGGTACANCTDGDPCTSDVCTAGVCSNPLAPSGTPCDDGLYCTSVDICDGRGRCVGGGGPRCDDGASCTRDLCDEETDSCTFTWVEGCLIGGVCVAEGAVNPSYPCQICDPTRNATDWSPRPAGTPCGMPRCTAGRLYPAGMCDATGTCITPPSVRCATGRCADATSCERTCADTGCPDGRWCSPSGACEPVRSVGEICIADAACSTGYCVDGRCCLDACDGVCERCDRSGSEGRCSPVPAGQDPDGECEGASVCDGAGSCIELDAGPGEIDAAVPARDAGVGDAGGGGTDVGAPLEADAGSIPAPRHGCGCAIPGSTERVSVALTGLIAVAAVAVRRRRRASRGHRRALATERHRGRHPPLPESSRPPGSPSAHP